MYSVSNDYLNAINQPVQSGYISGTVDGTAFTASDVLLGSASISNQCTDPNDIRLGGVNIGVLKITFINRNLVTRGSWENKEIVVNWSQLINEDPETYETVPCGIYIISEANHAAEGVVITAYDRMSLLDKTLPFTTMNGSIYSMLNVIATDCEVTLGMPREQIEALPNGEETFSIYPENDMKTYRDLLAWVSQTAACFSTFNRNGELILKQFSSMPILNISSDKRIAGGSFSDFHTFFTAISVVDIQNQVTKVEKLVPDDGLTMNLGSNPLLQFGLIDTLRRERMAILNGLSGFDYTPFNTTTLGNPIFDLGDVINCTGGIAGSSVKCCIMAFTYIFNRTFSMSGYGKNPSLFGAQSKTDKNLSGLSSRDKGNEIKYQVYTNAEEINLPRDPEYSNQLSTKHSGREEIAELNFSATKETAVEVQAIVRPLTKMSRQQIEYYYRQNKIINITREFNIVFEIDGETVESYRIYDYPVTRPMPGASESFEPYIPLKDMMEHYFALLHVEAGTQKTLRVYVEFDYYYPDYSSSAGGFYFKNGLGGNIHFDPEDIKIYLKGQGLSSELPWDGFISVIDNLLKYIIGNITIVDMEDQVSVNLLTNMVTTLSDDLDPYGIGYVLTSPIEESFNITFTKITSNLVTEDGEFNIVTEDDSYNIVTE